MMRLRRHFSPLVLFLFVFMYVSAGGAFAQEGAASSAAALRVERVARLCEAWTAAKFLHPYLAYRDLDWDAAFVEAAPAAWGAAGRAEYRAAAEGMLGVLEDSATEVREEPDADPPFTPGEPPPLFRWPEEGVLLLDVARFQRVAGPYALTPALWRGLERELEKARAVILDLRIAPEAGEGQDYSSWQLEGFAGRLVSREARGPAKRFLVHWGFRPQQGFSSGGYESGFVTSLATVYTPSDPQAPERPVVFLANTRTRLPDFAFALQASGTGWIVSEGPLVTDRLASHVTVELGEELEARIRATEIVTADGGAPAADREVAPADGGADPALEDALSLVAEPPSPRVAAAGAFGAAPPPPARWRPDSSYPEMTSPDLGHRLLAGCRLWGTIDLFYPYHHLLDDWDASFRGALPELAAAEDAEGYVRAVLRLAAHVEDGHTGVYGHPALSELRGDAFPPIQVREIEGRLVVTRVLDRAVRDLAAGDVIHAIDGTPIEDRIAGMWPLVTASRELTRRLVAARWAMAGPAGSTVTLSVSGADERRREVELPLGEPADPVPRDESDPWRLLEDTGNLRLGYVDLTRLQIPQVDAVIEALSDTDAIVFDLRGYPHGTARPLANWLNSRGAESWAQFRGREVSYQFFGLSEPGYYFIQELGEAREPTYAGRTVMLIDERAISQSEHTALGFEQAAGTVFVGTPTAGANGDVTSFFLPGGIAVAFTGHDVRHADGRQLQRVGIQPDVEAAPTIAGLRAGRDEVLERAVEYLRAELGDDE